MTEDKTDNKTDTRPERGTETIAPDGTFLKPGYNTDLGALPLDVEPLPRSRFGSAIDVRKLDGTVAIDDDDDTILDQDEGLIDKHLGVETGIDGGQRG